MNESAKTIKNPTPKNRTLPKTLPLFPLRNVLLLPHGRLPLNIFEPRYIAMVDHALATNRLIGMVRPKQHVTIKQSEDLQDPLYAIGCAGRIINFMETDDGRYLITLNGISRFHLTEEVNAPAPYRTAQANWSPFSGDPREAQDIAANIRTKLLTVLRTYLNAAGLKADWESIELASSQSIIHSVSMSCPFGPNEQQALLETPTITQRAETLITLMEISLAEGLEPQNSDTDTITLQ